MNDNFLIDIPELAAFRERWAVLPAFVKSQIRATLLRSAVTVQGVVRQEAPVRTGMLRNSFNYKVTDTMAIISSNTKYGSYVNNGTGLYGRHNALIVPLHAKVMATRNNPGWGKKNAKGYYIIGTHTQGQRANPFMRRAYERSVPLVKTEFSLMINALMKAVA